MTYLTKAKQFLERQHNPEKCDTLDSNCRWCLAELNINLFAAWLDKKDKECKHCMCYAGYPGEDNQFNCCRCGKKATVCMTAECPKGFFKHDVETEGCINFKLNK